LLNLKPPALILFPNAGKRNPAVFAGGRSVTDLPEKRLAAFLESAAPLLRRLGIEVDLPKALSRELKPRLVLKTGAKGSDALVSYLGLDSLLKWQWQVAIGDKIMDPAEIEKLLREKREIVRFRDGFVRLGADELAKLLKRAKNTFEEKIDAMLTSKRELAGMTVSSGESWLTRMSHAELKELFDR
jgi:hypothetical protein